MRPMVRRIKPLPSRFRSNEHYLTTGDIRYAIIGLCDGSHMSLECKLTKAYSHQGVITHYDVEPCKAEYRPPSALSMETPKFPFLLSSFLRVPTKNIFREEEKAAKKTFLMNLKRKG